MFKKFRHNLLTIFLFYTLTIAVVVYLSALYTGYNKRISKIQTTTQKLHKLIIADENQINIFFGFESRQTYFFETSESPSLKKHKQLNDSIFEVINQLKQLINKRENDIHENFVYVENSIQNKEFIIEKLIELTFLRGFIDFGTEGKMRHYAHKMESVPEIELSDVLLMRRHEKDYIIRNEQKYVNRLSEHIENVKSKINQNQYITSRRKKQIVELINNYKSEFEELVTLGRLIGFRDNEGLKLELNTISEDISVSIEQINEAIERKTKKRYNYLRFLFVLIAVIIVGISLISSLYMPRLVTKRISKLSKAVKNFIKSGFREENKIPTKRLDDEIGTLISNFIIMRKQIIELINSFEQKVEERTLEINHKKEEIETQRDMLFANNAVIEKQKLQLTKQNNNLLASIRYAKRIQTALMPQKQLFEDNFVDYFIMYYPKDIVSGDFYWIKNIQHQGSNLVLFAATDCTGHGVPGALMSMLGVAFLNDIVLKKKIVQPSLILDELRKNIISVLQQEDNKLNNREGMDIALCCLNKDSGSLQFAGANRPLYVVRNNELTKIKGDKIPIGGIPHKERCFENHEIKLDKNDAIYLFTDGLTDQLGGENIKKFKYKLFKKIITEHHTENMQKIDNYINIEFAKWQGNNKQTDDVLLLGLRPLVSS